MQNAIKREIKRLSDRAFQRAAQKENDAAEYRARFSKRTGVVAGISTKPKAAPLSKHFDPIYCKRHANFLAKTIWHKVLCGTYEPEPAVEFFLDKPGGGKRRLMSFSIPDAALGNVLMRRLRERNIKKFSPQSFAYHPDKNVFDAVLDLRGFIVTTPKLYSVQIDFKDYFDSIPKGYIEKVLDDKEVFSRTQSERSAIMALLTHRYAQRSEYAYGIFKRRYMGTPQGSSISLILANLANHHLDVSLGKLPGKFVRFADDVTAVVGSYEDAVKIEHAFHEHCSDSGIVMNLKKSPGIGIISNEYQEMRTYNHIDYLGYRFNSSGLTISDKAVSRIKKKISKIISIYLVQYIRDVGVNQSRFRSNAPSFDWDLLGLITEIRNYLYGGLTEAELRDAIHSGKKLNKMTGLMGFYCLLEDRKVLAQLDGWLVATVRRATRARAQIILSKTGAVGLAPGKSSLILGTWMDPDAWHGVPKPDFTLPSFIRGWRAARKYYYTFGLKEVDSPSYSYSYAE